MNVSALYIYPFKSGPPVAVSSALTTPLGFQHDRQFVVTGTDGVFLTQRTHPRLGQCTALFDGTEFILTATCGDIRLAAADGEIVDVRVWSDQLQARRCGAETEQWFAELLQQDAWVVQLTTPRTADDAVAPLNFADAFPYNFATTSSLDVLNARIAGPPVPMAAFRPNIVIDGTDAWQEDDWTTVRAGEATFHCTTNCERCRIPTLDPAFPDRPRRDGEPLRSLAKMRRNARGKVDFARYAVADVHGVVRVGDRFEVLV